MTTRKASYGSNSFAYDASLLMPASGSSHRNLHESSAATSDARSITPFIVPETSPCLQNNASAGIKSDSIKAEKAFMQSRWIQRLARQTIDHEEEKLAEPSHVRTHFTKDFSSCSKRLHKTLHHMRAPSWPPIEQPPKLSPFSHGKPREPVKHYLLSRASTEENSSVPFVDDATESSNLSLRARNLLLNQSSCSASVSTSEALVPHLQHRYESRTCDESLEGEIRDEGKLQGCTAQNFSKYSEKVTSAVSGGFTSLGKPSLYPDFNREDGPLQEAVSLKRLGDAPCKGKSVASKFAHRFLHLGGSSPDAVIRTSLSPEHMGASADAEKLLLSRSLVKDVNPSTPQVDLSKFSDNRLCKVSLRASPAPPYRCGANGPAVVFGDTQKKMSQTELGVCYQKNPEIAGDMEVKTRRNFGFLHFGGQFKELNQPTSKPCVSSGSCKGVGSDRFYVGNRASGLLTTSKSAQRKTAVGASTSATSAVPVVSKHYSGSRPFITDLRRSDSIVADHPLNPKKYLASELPLTRVASQDFTRSSLRETSLDDYWVQLFEDPGPVKPFERGSSTANLHRQPVTEEFFRHPLSLRENTLKIDGEEKFEYLSRPSLHLPLNTNAQTHYSCNLPQRTQGSPRKSVFQTKHTGLGHNQGDSTDRISLDRSIIPKMLQDESVHSSKRQMGRLALQDDRKDLNFRPESSNNAASGVSMFFGNQSYKFCDDGETNEASRPNQSWIQRWRSSSTLIPTSGNTVSPSFCNDGDLGSDPARLPVISSHRERKGVNCYNGNLTEPGNKYIEGLANFDSGSGSTPRGSFPAYRCHASLSCKYRAPSVEAMAIVGNTASKHHKTSLPNRGSFSVWPCPSADNFEQRSVDNFEQRRFAEHAKETVDDNMHGAMDMDELEFLDYK